MDFAGRPIVGLCSADGQQRHCRSRFATASYTYPYCFERFAFRRIHGRSSCKPQRDRETLCRSLAADTGVRMPTPRAHRTDARVGRWQLLRSVEASVAVPARSRSVRACARWERMEAILGGTLEFRPFADFALQRILCKCTASEIVSPGCLPHGRYRRRFVLTCAGTHTHTRGFVFCIHICKHRSLCTSCDVSNAVVYHTPRPMRRQSGVARLGSEIPLPQSRPETVRRGLVRCWPVGRLGDRSVRRSVGR